MPFHVEVRRSVHRAWAFNLDGETLRRTVLEPWARGAVLRLGDRDWEPSKSSLRVLEGERLHPADLAHGQGWNHASRDGRDVARELLTTMAAHAASHAAGQARGQDAGQASGHAAGHASGRATREALAEAAAHTAGRATILAVTDEQRAATGALLHELGLTVVDWRDVRPALLAHDGAPPPVQAAVLVAGVGAPADWHLDAGIALGAIGRGVVAISSDPDAPATFAGLHVIRIAGERDAQAVDELADRLRLAGCAVRRRRAPLP